jgi:hypothetical protein
MATQWLLLPPRYGVSLLVRRRYGAPSDFGGLNSMALGLLFGQGHRVLAHSHVGVGGQACDDAVSQP